MERRVCSSCVLGVLVSSKAYGVTRAAAVPRLLPPELTLVKANRVTESHAPLAEAAQALAARGARAVVLGCTEIPLGIAAGPAQPFPVIDTIQALALASIRWARDEVA